MADTKIQKAKLKGHHGPFFPAKLGRIQKRFQYESIRWNLQFFDAVADRLHAGKVSWHPKTSDGYLWMVMISFLLGKIRYKVLFPMMNDTVAMRDGTNSDRHIAIYSSEPVDAHQLDYAAKMFADDLIAVYRHLYENAIRDGKKSASNGS